MADETLKVGIISCSGEEIPEGTVSRMATRRVLELLRPGQTVTLCLPLFLAGGEGERAFAREHPTIAVDGCEKQCAKRGTERHSGPVSAALVVSEILGDAYPGCHRTLREWGDSEKAATWVVADQIAAAVDAILEQSPQGTQASGGASCACSRPLPATVTHDKYLFQIPSAGYLFNENDCWVRVSGTRARVGVSDYVQQKLTDILYYEPAKVGATVEQFGEAGVIESTKAVLEVVSPVSGTVIAVNTALLDNPGLVNEEPYAGGWIAEIELGDFEADRELLIDGAAYAALVKRKAVEDAK